MTGRAVARGCEGLSRQAGQWHEGLRIGAMAPVLRGCVCQQPPPPLLAPPNPHLHPQVAPTVTPTHLKGDGSQAGPLYHQRLTHRRQAGATLSHLARRHPPLSTQPTAQPRPCPGTPCAKVRAGGRQAPRSHRPTTNVRAGSGAVLQETTAAREGAGGSARLC